MSNPLNWGLQRGSKLERTELRHHSSQHWSSAQGVSKFQRCTCQGHVGPLIAGTRKASKAEKLWVWPNSEKPRASNIIVILQVNKQIILFWRKSARLSHFYPCPMSHMSLAFKLFLFFVIAMWIPSELTQVLGNLRCWKLQRIGDDISGPAEIHVSRDSADSDHVAWRWFLPWKLSLRWSLQLWSSNIRAILVSEVSLFCWYEVLRYLVSHLSHLSLFVVK